MLYVLCFVFVCFVCCVLCAVCVWYVLRFVMYANYRCVFLSFSLSFSPSFSPSFFPRYAHRDIKPQNILFSDTTPPQPMVMDLGSAGPCTVRLLRNRLFREVFINRLLRNQWA